MGSMRHEWNSKKKKNDFAGKFHSQSGRRTYIHFECSFILFQPMSMKATEFVEYAICIKNLDSGFQIMIKAAWAHTKLSKYHILKTEEYENIILETIKW